MRLIARRSSSEIVIVADGVVDDDGELRLSVHTSAEGKLWSIPPVLDLLRIDMSLEGRAIH